jgi:ankyrin repeat protein
MRFRRRGGTALHQAANENHVEMAKLLLEHHADVNAKAKWVLPVQLLRCRCSLLLR